MFPFSRRSRNPAAAAPLAAALVWLIEACAPAGGPVTPSPPPAPPEHAVTTGPAPDPCLVRPRGGPLSDTVRVVAGAAFVQRQLYPSLARLDCAGRLRPLLAESWAPADGGRTWIVHLRPDARFWDGSPVTATAVADAWGADSGLESPAGSGIVGVAAEGERDLRLSLAVPGDSVPPLLGDPSRPVIKRSSDPDRPIGAGAYRPADPDSPPVLLVPVDSGVRPVRLLTPPRDLRDALDAGADLVVTDDPATITYAASRPDLTAIALPWDRTYALLAADVGSGSPQVDSGLRQALARDAVRVDARAAETVPPADTPCGDAAGSGARSGTPASSRGDHIAYPAGDRTARDLAARLLALGTTSARSVLPLPSEAFTESLESGREIAYVVRLRLGPPAACTERVAWPPGAAVIPLVDTREHVVVRDGAPPFTVDRDGTLRLLPGAM